MAYDLTVVERVRGALKRRRGISERKMFGGISFLLNGNMCCGVVDSDLVLRLGRARAARALDDPHTREMDFTGRPLRTMVYVDADGFSSDADLKAWIDQAVAYVKTLPGK